MDKAQLIALIARQIIAASGDPFASNDYDMKDIVINPDGSVHIEFKDGSSFKIDAKEEKLLVKKEYIATVREMLADHKADLIKLQAMKKEGDEAYQLLCESDEEDEPEGTALSDFLDDIGSALGSLECVIYALDNALVGG